VDVVIRVFLRTISLLMHLMPISVKAIFVNDYCMWKTSLLYVNDLKTAVGWLFPLLQLHFLIMCVCSTEPMKDFHKFAILERDVRCNEKRLVAKQTGA